MWYRWQPKDDKCIIIEYRFWMIPHDWTQGVLIRIRKQCHFVWHWNWILWITKSITYHSQSSTITKNVDKFFLFISNGNVFYKQILEMGFEIQCPTCSFRWRDIKCNMNRYINCVTRNSFYLGYREFHNRILMGIILLPIWHTTRKLGDDQL